VWRERLHKTGPFLRGLLPFPIESIRLFQHTIDAAGADRDNIIVEHHEGEPPITIEWMGSVVIEDRLFLSVFEPPITGNFSVVFVGLAIATFPSVELAGAES